MITKTEILETTKKDLEEKISKHEKVLDEWLCHNHGKEPYEYGYIQPWISKEEMHMLACRYKPAWNYVYFFHTKVIEYGVPSTVSMFVLSETPLDNLQNEYGRDVYECKNETDSVRHEYVSPLKSMWRKMKG